MEPTEPTRIKVPTPSWGADFLAALWVCGGNQDAAAKLCGKNARTVHRAKRDHKVFGRAVRALCSAFKDPRHPWRSPVWAAQKAGGRLGARRRWEGRAARWLAGRPAREEHG